MEVDPEEDEESQDLWAARLQALIDQIDSLEHADSLTTSQRIRLRLSKTQLRGIWEEDEARVLHNRKYDGKIDK